MHDDPAGSCRLLYPKLLDGNMSELRRLLGTAGLAVVVLGSGVAIGLASGEDGRARPVEVITQPSPSPGGDDDADVGVSADGRWLAWVEQPCTGEAVLKIREPGTGVAGRTFGMGNPRQVQGKPAWAPDNRHLAYFYRGGGGAPYGVHVLDTTTAQHADEGRSLVDSRCYQQYPNYLADGSLVVLTCADEDHPDTVVARRFDPDTGQATETLFTLEGVAPDGLVSVAAFDLSPDGRHALYQTAPAEGPSTTWRWDGGRPRRLAHPVAQPNW